MSDGMDGIEDTRAWAEQYRRKQAKLAAMPSHDEATNPAYDKRYAELIREWPGEESMGFAEFIILKLVAAESKKWLRVTNEDKQ
jgi:hypothetical protein